MADPALTRIRLSIVRHTSVFIRKLMKQLLRVFVLSIILPATGSAQTVELVDKYMAAWNNHDPVAAADFFDENVEYYDASTGTPVIGRLKAQTEIVTAFLRAVPDLKWTRDQESPIVGTEGIAFRWTFSGTNSGNWSDGTKATHKWFLIRGATLMRISKGKIVFQGDYYDAHALYKQIGLAQ